MQTIEITVTYPAHVPKAQDDRHLPRHRRHDAPEVAAAVAVSDFLHFRKGDMTVTFGDLADVIARAMGTEDTADTGAAYYSEALGRSVTIPED